MKTLALLAFVAMSASSCVVANVHARFYHGELHRKMTCLFDAGGPGVVPEARCGPPEIMDLVEQVTPAPEPNRGSL